MANKLIARITKDIFKPHSKRQWETTPHAGVGQDNNALSRERIPMVQAVADRDIRRTLPLNGIPHQPTTPHSTRRKREYVMLWVDPIVKSELERRAKRNGLSLSATGSALLKRALQENIDTEYGA